MRRLFLMMSLLMLATILDKIAEKILVLDLLQSQLRQTRSRICAEMQKQVIVLNNYSSMCFEY